MNVLYVAAEAHPLIKTGGLADVAGSLPKALKKLGVDIRTVLPLYGQIPEKYKREMKYEGYFYVDLNWRHEYCGVFSLKIEGVTHYLLDNEHYFHRNQVYGESDDGERFLFFCKAVALLPSVLDFWPDIIHANDWHSGMVPVFLHDFAKGDERYQAIRSVFTIHNLKYQGIFHHSILGNVAGLSMRYFNEDALKYYDAINFMKGGIVFSQFVTTVSPSYALEIQDPYYGEKLDGLLRHNSFKLAGYINGIDTDYWNPSKDQYVDIHYDEKSLDKKSELKTQLQEQVGLPVRDVPLLAMVSRLVEAKGLDLINYITDELMQDDVQIVILGTGDHQYEEALHYFTWRYPDKFHFINAYNEAEAHLIYAAADLYLMPSFYEPCGISQLIAMRYGTLPIVRETGGLRDTVQPYNEYTGEGTGFSFANINAHDFLHTIRRALYYYGEKDIFRKIQKQAMEQDNSWKQTAQKMKESYERIQA